MGSASLRSLREDGTKCVPFAIIEFESVGFWNLDGARSHGLLTAATYYIKRTDSLVQRSKRWKHSAHVSGWGSVDLMELALSGRNQDSSDPAEAPSALTTR